MRSRAFPLFLAALALGCLCSGLRAQAPAACPADWIPTFGGAPFPGHFDSTVRAIATYDDGHGPALYAGGDFDSGTAPNFLGRFDGWGWSSLGTPIVGGNVRALAVFDDGTGPALFVAGGFTSIGGVAANHIAKWDGANWSPLGSGTVGASIDALTVFDDGSGAQLYAGGSFQNAGGIIAENLARWNGSRWSAMATGMNGSIHALCAFDDGGGSALYAGGLFANADGQSVNHIARWNSNGWSPLGSGVIGSGLAATTVDALALFDGGSGTELVAAGAFTNAGGSAANHIARWNGTAWSTLGVGVSAPVAALQVFDDGSGSALFAGGEFSSAGGVSMRAIARWDGANWSALAAGLGLGGAKVKALANFDDGHGDVLEVGGHFATAGGKSVNQLASWSSAGWAVVGRGLDGTVSAVASYDNGAGLAIYAGGTFQHAGNDAVQRIAKWNGSSWSTLPSGPFASGSGVISMTVFDFGGIPRLFVGSYGGSDPLTYLDISGWTPVSGAPGNVRAMQAFDDGSGAALYVVGGFGNVVSKWTGTSWSSVGGGANGIFRALAVYDDGSGPALYAGGQFTTVGAVSTNGIARWDGATWVALGSGLGASLPLVNSLAVYDDGSGPGLYAAGNFSTAGGANASSIARWDGMTWSRLSSGLRIPGNGGTVRSIAAYDDGSGTRLFACGIFTSAGGVPVHGIANWDGAAWRAMEYDLGASPTGYSFETLAVVDEGGAAGKALIVGGTFLGASGADSFLAKWDVPVGCGALGSSFCSPGSAGTIACPCANPPAGADRGCDNSSSSGGAQLLATGFASLTGDLVNFSSTGQTPGATSILLQGDAANASGAVFGQGVRCVAGALKRLYTQTAVNGAISIPTTGDTPVSARSAALGDTIVAGQHRYYGVYYRDPLVLGGCAASSTFNVTQQVDLAWTP
ncbi:MAG: hypothetical protein IPJ19_09610 [Planctomycetes bacterium]|nr:hypothetical protein [Planctomycetota bacterium]